MSNKIEIKTITLNLGGAEISITPEQAKKLYGLLKEMFGEPETANNYWPVTYRDHISYWEWPYKVWCESDGTGAAQYSCQDNGNLNITI